MCVSATPEDHTHAVHAVHNASSGSTLHTVHAATGLSEPMLHSVYAVMPQGKLRLDAYLTSQLPQSSRGKLQAAIKAGNVVVNGKPELKTSLGVRPGDAIECVLLEPPVMQALPEVAAALS